MLTKFFDPTLVRTPDQAVEFIGSILESSTEYSIIGKDLEGNVVLWNEGACRLYGYRPEEVVGKINGRLLHSAEDIAAGKPQEMLETALRTGHWEGIAGRRRKDGSGFNARVVVTLRRDAAGKAVGFLLMSKEVANDAVYDLAHASRPFDSAIIGTDDLSRAVSQMTLQRTALEAAAGIIITDAAGVIVWVNPAFTTTTGYTSEEALGKTLRIMMSGLDDEEFYADFWRTVSSGKIWRGEFASRRKNGELYYDEHVITPVRGEDGRITHFINIMHDITERKAAYDELREAHQQMRDLLEHSPAVLYALGVSGASVTPRMVSRNITRLLGFEVSETLTLEWWLDHLHPEDRSRAEASVAETLAAGTSRTEYRLQHKDGTYRWVEDNRRVVYDGDQRPVELVGVWTDITERKRAQDESRASESRLRSILNNLELVALTVDSDARITYCNDYFLRLTGWERGDIIGRDWFEQFIAAEDQASVREMFRSLLADSPEAWHHTNAIVTRSGEKRTIQWNNSVLRSLSGAVIGVATVGEDVTSRLSAEQEVRSNEERLRIFMDASTDAMWEWNVETGTATWSDRAYAMLGYERETFVPSYEAVLQVVHPDDRAGALQAFTDHRDHGKQFRFRARIRKGDGSFLPIFVRGQLRHETAQMVGVFTDLSILEHASEHIREQAALIDQARDAIVVRDLDDLVVFWSKGAERLYELRADEAIGRRFDELLQMDADEFEAAKRRVIAEGAWSGELEKPTAAGNTLIVDCSWTLLRDDQGLPKSIFSIDTDITERKSLEQQFFRAQRLESLGTLAGGIAHDLNNLLMPMLMGVTLLKRLEPGEKSLRAINNIESSVRRGADLVKQVLLFARGAEGTRGPLDVAATVTEVQAILESTFPKNIAFTITVPPTLARIFGDATQMNQVVLNLCVNARDAMPAGGQITITAREVDIDLAYALKHGGTVAGKYVVIEVADSGTGMTKEVMDRIFEPFFTTKGLTKGTGLGLSTARGIVRSHAGFIAVSSKVGKGSTFCVYLPAYNGAGRAEAMTAPVTDAARGHGEVILIVDDETAIVDVMRQTLQSFGYAVMTASNGAEAVALYEHEHANIAAVVTDVMMPVMDGHELIAALRRIDDRVPIIAMSGHVEQADVPAGFPTGVTAFLAKPYSAGVMLRTVSSVLQRGAA